MNDSNMGIEIRNGVATLVDSSKVAPDLEIYHYFSVTDAAVVGLLHLSVTCINLAGCRAVTDETLRAIARNCRSLESIDVGVCKVLMDGGRGFSERCGFCVNDDVLNIVRSFPLQVQTALFLLRASSDNLIEERQAPRTTTTTTTTFILTLSLIIPWTMVMIPHEKLLRNASCLRNLRVSRGGRSSLLL
jgi:hypothetical protein